MKISLVQMNSQPDRARNLAEAERLMRDAMQADRPDLIVLPEHFDWSGGTVAQKREAADAIPGGAAYHLARNFAARNKVWVHAGSILERIPDSNQIYNSTVVFDASGNEVGLYRKIHLFDIVAPDGKQYFESASVAPGNELLIYELDGLRIGCAICYDLRFSRLFDRLAAERIDAVILPASFTLQTGKDHWEVLCRARAIEFQAYFVACGQWGAYPAASGEIRESYGHSMICDPWGHVVARASDKVGFISWRLDRERLESVRKLIPMAEHRVDLRDAIVKVGAGQSR
jgi:deaminated glutathione amidase